MDYRAYLKSIYFDVNCPASFTGPGKLYQFVKSQGKYNISRNKIKHWLQEQDVYTLHKDIKRKFSRRRIITSGVDIQWGADLASVSNTAKYNVSVNYLLVVTDIFSKYLFVEPLKTKRAKDVADAFDRILRHGRSPQILQTDKGGEFNNRLFKSELRKKGIGYFTSQNEDVKVSPVERIIRTIRNKMHKMFQSNRSYRYLEHLQALVDSYNQTPHRSLPDNMSPAEVTKENEAVIWDYMYNKHRPDFFRPSKSNSRFKFNVGEMVRLAYVKYPFQRDYQQKWTSEIFKISNRSIKQGVPVYNLTDLANDKVSGTFYQEELQLIKKDENALWIIEKVILKRKRNGDYEYLVKYEGWPDKFNSWVKKDDIETINSKQ